MAEQVNKTNMSYIYKGLRILANAWKKSQIFNAIQNAIKIRASGETSCQRTGAITLKAHSWVLDKWNSLIEGNQNAPTLLD